MPDRAAWRPGPPSEACVCDVRCEGTEWKNARYHGIRVAPMFNGAGPERHAEFTCGPGASLLVGEAGFALISWRPIPVPEGVPEDA